MRYQNIPPGRNPTKVEFEGHANLVCSVLVPMILIRCGTPEEIREILIDGEGDVLDYASLSILKEGAKLSQYVDDDADGFSDTFLDAGSVVALSYPGDEYRWGVVSKSEYLKILQVVLTTLIEDRVIYDPDDVAGVLEIVSGLKGGKGRKT